jgi:hyaluronan synthase
MTLPLYYYVLGTPLGLLGLFRWSCWLVRRIPAVLDIRCGTTSGCR